MVRESIGSTQINYWFDPKTKKIYDFDGEHAIFALRNPEKLDIQRKSLSFSGTKDVIDYLLKKGWVRVKYYKGEYGDLPELNVQSISSRTAYQTVRFMLDRVDFQKLYLDIHKVGDTVKLRFWENLKPLVGNRLEFYLKRGKIPSEMVRENKRAVWTFGRFQPITIAHEQLIKEVMKLSEGADHFIFTSRSHDNKTNPLNYDLKLEVLKTFIPEANFYRDESIINPFAAAHWLNNNGYTDITIVVGSDRANDLKESISNYIGHPDPEKCFNFKRFEVINFGDRIDEGDGISGISSTKARKFAADNDFESFCKIIPEAEEKYKQALFHEVRKGLGIKESVTETQEIRKLINTLNKIEIY